MAGSGGDPDNSVETELGELMQNQEDRPLQPQARSAPWSVFV